MCVPPVLHTPRSKAIEKNHGSTEGFDKDLESIRARHVAADKEEAKKGSKSNAEKVVAVCLCVCPVYPKKHVLRELKILNSKCFEVGTLPPPDFPLPCIAVFSPPNPNPGGGNQS